ncbi:PAS domain S-box protein [Botryobacter ruber]|uniref:PAS domain S-box protein n=1 Tax=Botryobacter ruber TaxID=2171629 RepID=UPI000E0B02BD|nr:PAS domain S-box protein [Botryobacter ruber]
MKNTFTPDFYESLVKTNTDLIAVLDQTGVYKYVSEAAESVLGYPAHELAGKNSLGFVHEDDLAFVVAALQKVRTRESLPLPLFRMRTIAGDWKWFEGKVTNKLEDKAVQGLVTVIRNVPEQVDAQSTNAPGEVFYHALFYNHPDAVFTLDGEGKYIEVNAHVSQLTGYSKQELLGTSFLQYIHPAYYDRAQESLNRANQGVSHTAEELSIVTRQQTEAIVCLTIVPVLLHGAVIGIQGIAKNITKDKEAEEQIRKQAEQLNSIIESIADPFIVLDEQWRYAYVNSAFAAYLGKDTEEFIGRNVWKLSPELKTPLFYKKSLEVAATNEPVSFYETFSELSSAPTTMHISIFPFMGGFSVFFNDVTFEKELQGEFEKLSLVVSKTTNGIIILSQDRKIEWINSGFTRLTGYTLTDVLQKRPGAILRGPETNKRTVSRIDDQFALGIPFSEEVLNYRKTGEQIWVKLDVIPILNEKRKVVKFISILTDITDKKKSEHKLLQLATDLYKQNRDLQQFTYIVSHNLRAPLANATGLTNLLCKVKKESPMFDEALQKLKISMRRLDNVVSDINSVLTIRDSEQVAAKEQVVLLEVCQQVLASLKDQLTLCGATVNVEIPPDYTVHTNKVYLYNILHSLLANALKYRSETRPLEVTIRCRRYGKSSTAISITDNGTGMDMEKVKDSIFTLYKRFHPHVEGKGIGLFLVKAQVESLGGRIKVKSKPDAGTTFTIFL